MNSFIIAICCLAGSAFIGLLGWMKSNEPWDTRKFLSTILGGVGTAIVFGIGYQFTGLSLNAYDILTAIASGMGIGAAVPTVSGAIAARVTKSIK